MENLTIKEIKSEKKDNVNKVELVISTIEKTGKITLEGKGSIKEAIALN